jgi:ABC-type nitrate/sulfonate/bicarbonate transport system substrate-binding protein
LQRLQVLRFYCSLFVKLPANPSPSATDRSRPPLNRFCPLFLLGQRKGFFAQEGINLEMTPIEGGAANMVVALNKGVVDITRTATPYLIQDVLKGAGGAAIAGETLTPIYSLIANRKSRHSPI